MSGSRRWLLLPLALVISGYVLGDFPSPGLVGSRAAATTHDPSTFPSPPKWETETFDLEEYFTRAELNEWSAFANKGRALSLSGLLLSVIVYALFALTRVGRASHRLAEKLTRRLGSALTRRFELAGRLSAVPSRLFGQDWASALVFTWIFLIAASLALLPLQILGEFESRAMGLSVYTNLAWIWDFSKSLVSTAISLSFLVFGLFGLIRRMPQRWWIALGAPASVMMVAWGVISPIQSRVYYDFRPLDDESLQARFEELAARKGISLLDVKVIDASRHTRGINAYVTGLGPSRELVLFDTTLDILDADELEAVLAHELGHVEREMPMARYALSGVVLLAMLWMLSILLRKIPNRLGLDGPGDPRALPLLLLVISLVFLTARPMERAYSRYEERLADRSGLMLTGEPDAFISLKVALARHNRADVDPPRWAVLWFASHPPLAERIGMARWYRTWLSDQTNESEDPLSRGHGVE